MTYINLFKTSISAELFAHTHTVNQVGLRYLSHCGRNIDYSTLGLSLCLLLPMSVLVWEMKRAWITVVGLWAHSTRIKKIELQNCLQRKRVVHDCIRFVSCLVLYSKHERYLYRYYNSDVVAVVKYGPRFIQCSQNKRACFAILLFCVILRPFYS